MPSLTFYGSVNEIGGNKFLFEADSTKLFLDFGMSFKIANQYFAEFLQLLSYSLRFSVLLALLIVRLDLISVPVSSFDFLVPTIY